MNIKLYIVMGDGFAGDPIDFRVGKSNKSKVLYALFDKDAPDFFPGMKHTSPLVLLLAPNTDEGSFKTLDADKTFEDNGVGDDSHIIITEESTRNHAEGVYLTMRKTPPGINSDDTDKTDKNQVFVVHGHDSSAKLEISSFINDLGLEPIILHEQASGGATIIEKIEQYSNVGFAVVLYTPCDLGAKNEDNYELSPRARQNVVFEHGYLIGKLNRGNVCALVKGEVEIPNDISGVAYVNHDKHGGWKIKLARELRKSGYAVDMNDVI